MRPHSLERRGLDALPITGYAVDLEGRITFVNRMGASSGDEHAALGSAIWDVVGERGLRVQIEQAMASLRQGGAAVSWELPVHSPTGERTELVQIAPLLEGQAVTGYTVTTVDLTASHRAREQRQRVAAV